MMPVVPLTSISTFLKLTQFVSYSNLESLGLHEPDTETTGEEVWDKGSSSLNCCKFQEGLNSELTYTAVNKGRIEL